VAFAIIVILVALGTLGLLLLVPLIAISRANRALIRLADIVQRIDALELRLRGAERE
jgi:hypothetical protein